MIKKLEFRKHHVLKAVGILVVGCVLNITIAHAQEGPENIGDGLGDENTTVPFDGNVSLLVVAGVIYGAKKRYDTNNKYGADDNSKTNL